jgi:hypothetical protein
LVLKFTNINMFFKRPNQSKLQGIRNTKEKTKYRITLIG